MTVSVRNEGALRPVAQINVRDAGNVIRSADRILVRTAAGLIEFFRRAIRGAVTPTVATGTSNGRNATFTNSVMASASGGTAPYSCQWFVPAPFTAVSPNSATTAFRTPIRFEGETLASVTITDAGGLTISASVQVVIEAGSFGTEPIQ